MVVFNLFEGPGMSDHAKGGGLIGAVISGAIFMIPTVALFRARGLFTQAVEVSKEQAATKENQVDPTALEQINSLTLLVAQPDQGDLGVTVLLKYVIEIVSLNSVITLQKSVNSHPSVKTQQCKR